ncbi:hypothetical protein ACHAWO_007553 [Cyclotella atomus]|uniref:DNA topoisomerase (ATP-hydrolyzing) n=1 Tax=Cyclotella atomus TaxID=382360 RepID=A0ABD3NL07_9STRA
MDSSIAHTPKTSPPLHYNDSIVWNREEAPLKRPQPNDETCQNDDQFEGFDEKQQQHYGVYHQEQQFESDEEMAHIYHDEVGDELHYQEGDSDSIVGNNFNVHQNYYQDPFDYLEQINQLQPPPTLFEEYDADDEYQLEQEVPIRQISIQDNAADDDDEDASLEYSEDNSYQDQIHSQQRPPHYEENSSQDVIHRIEMVMSHLVNYLSKLEGPILHEYKNPYTEESSNSTIAEDSISSNFFTEITKYNSSPFKQFDNMARQRVFTSVVLIMSFIHSLLLSNRTTTTREVYYVFVTHFRNQKECDSAILDVARCLGVPRRALGLSASPKGWFCGSIEITRKGTLPSGKDVSGSIDGTALSSIQGLPITREWIDRDANGFTEEGVEIKVTSKDAKVIVVIEKEGVYNRLAEERIFDKFPCILITGKGFPDLATRALVQSLHREFDLPVVGICDSNPFGISVLSIYHCAGDRMGVDGNMKYSVPIRWIGLRPSTVADLEDQLPKEVFQKLTDRDYKRIDALLDETHSFLNEEREEEILAMKDAGYKVELEALYWLGPDYMGNWVVEQLEFIDDEDEWERVAI